MWNHWVARANTPFEPFKNFEDCRRTWTSLTGVFPELLSAVLMPNHVHLLLPRGSPAALSRLGGVLGAVSKWTKRNQLWQVIPAPIEIPDRQHLRRQIRYLALNPCRKQLCSDPLEWYWSTYREVVGATVEGGERSARLANALGESSKGFAVRFHGYVSGDPSVRVDGTPYPERTIPGEWAQHSITEILAASAAALRLLHSDVEKSGSLRILFIHSAYRHGWRQPSLLAKICKCSRRSIHRILNDPIPIGIEATDLCLGDSRLRDGSNQYLVKVQTAKRGMKTKEGGGRFS